MLPTGPTIVRMFVVFITKVPSPSTGFPDSSDDIIFKIPPKRINFLGSFTGVTFHFLGESEKDCFALEKPPWRLSLLNCFITNPKPTPEKPPWRLSLVNCLITNPQPTPVKSPWRLLLLNCSHHKSTANSSKAILEIVTSELSYHKSKVNKHPDSIKLQ